MSKYLIKKDGILMGFDTISDKPNAYLPPVGSRLNNEMTDVLWRKGDKVGYHEHATGIETFYVVQGLVEVVVRGKCFVLEPGDILQLAPFTPHNFKFPEDNTIWRELFTDLEMHKGIRTKNDLRTFYPEKAQDPEFMKIISEICGDIKLEEPIAEDVDKRTVYEVRTPEFAHNTFEMGGMKLRMKVGRWETFGVKEIWEVIFEKGVKLSNKEEPEYSIGLFSITKGSFEFEVGHETFIAEPGDLVQIPEFVSYSFKALEDGSTFFDLNCQSYMLRLLETIRGYKERTPEKLQDKEFVKKMLLKHDCYITGYERE